MIATFSHTDFDPLSALITRKEQLKETVSVVLPAYNEAPTIGPIVESISRLKESSGCIDEIIVMDDASDDATASTARNAGAQVFQVGQVVPAVSVRGKGAALWKSQFVATGSILVFVDADLLDFSDRLVTGPVGALLHDPALQLVKASYRRPLGTGLSIADDSGGRVTELLIRPLLNLFLPELAGLHQPLAGEYAARSASLAQRPFYSGYGVETGLLLDYSLSGGIGTIGQVDVGTRRHRNRTLPELSRMSFDIGRIFFELLEQHGCCTTSRSGNTTMKVLDNGVLKDYKSSDVRLPPKTQFTEVPVYGN